MSEGGFNFPFGGDPEDLMRGLREFAEQQAESVAETQREQFATLTLNTAVELTAAALALEQTIQPPPRLASPEYLDAVGAAVRRLELALGDSMSSPFAEAMTQAVGVVGELEREVLSGYKGALT